MDALKKFNSYIVETKVYANMIKEGNDQNEMKEIFQKIETLKEESKQMAKNSDNLRP